MFGFSKGKRKKEKKRKQNKRKEKKTAAKQTFIFLVPLTNELSCNA